jgi:hypothetical protein
LVDLQQLFLDRKQAQLVPGSIHFFSFPFG